MTDENDVAIVHSYVNSYCVNMNCEFVNICNSSSVMLVN